MNAIYFIRDIYNGETRLFCFNEEEKNQIISQGKKSETDFHKATTFEEINDCIQMKQKVMGERTRQKSYSHPTCSITRKNILEKLVKYTKGNIILTPMDIDIYFGRSLKTKMHGEIYTTRTDENFKNFWKNLQIKRDFTLILKASDNFGGIEHTFTIFIDINIDNYNKPYIDEICVVDTAQTPVLPELFAKTIAIRLDLPYDGEIHFMFEKSNFVKYGMSLQQEEKNMNMRGYCGAWSLYFIYNFIRFEKLDRGVENKTILKKLYEYLVDKRNVLTALIIHWWDTIVYKPEINIEEWQEITELQQVLPSNDIIPDIDYDEMSDDEMSDE